MPAPEEPESPAGPDAVLRALADPHRRQIIRLVRDDELPAGQIATHFALDATGGQPASDRAQAGRTARRAARRHPAGSTASAGSRSSRCASCSKNSGPMPWTGSSRPSNETTHEEEQHDHATLAFHCTCIHGARIHDARHRQRAHRGIARGGVPLLHRSGAGDEVDRRLGRARCPARRSLPRRRARATPPGVPSSRSTRPDASSSPGASTGTPTCPRGPARSRSTWRLRATRRS